jgi:4-hydroxybenzoate polyprenyltransferase
MIVVLIAVFYAAPLGNAFLIGTILVAVLLTYEHSIVKPHDLSRVNTAFFNVNGAVSLVLMALTIADVMVG